LKAAAYGKRAGARTRGMLFANSKFNVKKNPACLEWQNTLDIDVVYVLNGASA